MSSQHAKKGDNPVTYSTSINYSDHAAVLGYAEIMTDPLSGEEGRVIWFQKDVGNGQLSNDYVYNDPQRAFLTEEILVLRMELKKEISLLITGQARRQQFCHLRRS